MLHQVLGHQLGAHTLINVPLAVALHQGRAVVHALMGEVFVHGVLVHGDAGVLGQGLAHQVLPDHVLQPGPIGLFQGVHTVCPILGGQFVQRDAVAVGGVGQFGVQNGQLILHQLLGHRLEGAVVIQPVQHIVVLLLFQQLGADLLAHVLHAGVAVIVAQVVGHEVLSQLGGLGLAVNVVDGGVKLGLLAAQVRVGSVGVGEGDLHLYDVAGHGPDDLGEKTVDQLVASGGVVLIFGAAALKHLPVDGAGVGQVYGVAVLHRPVGDLGVGGVAGHELVDGGLKVLLGNGGESLAGGNLLVIRQGDAGGHVHPVKQALVGEAQAVIGHFLVDFGLIGGGSGGRGCPLAAGEQENRRKAGSGTAQRMVQWNTSCGSKAGFSRPGPLRAV